jgi:hypothetical protein
MKSVLRRILEHNERGVVGRWRKLHNIELHNLYASQNIIRIIN